MKKRYGDERGLSFGGRVAWIDATPNFGTMGQDEDPDAYDRLRDQDVFVGRRYGRKGWRE